MKKILGNMALAGFALFIAFSFCEVVVRLLYKNESMLFPRYHTDYQYGRYTIRGVRPNSEYWMSSVDGSWKYVTNSKGFRNTKEFSYAKPANTIRVLSIGDSHTQGYEVRQDFTFSAVLERFLKHRAKHAEIINTGVSGFSNAEELVFLENEGIKYNPDVVVLGFFANDFEDNLKAGLFGLDSQSRLTEKKYQHIPGVRIQNVIYSIPGVQWLSENSYFYSLLFNNVWSYFASRLAQEAEYAVPTGATSSEYRNTFKANAMQKAEHVTPVGIASNRYRDTIKVEAIQKTGYALPVGIAASSSYPIELAVALIERMQQFCSERGIRFIVVDIPYAVGERRFQSSMPPALLERLVAARIELIGSQYLLQKFDGAAELHVPHGHNHISEFTHSLIGVEIGQRLLAPSNVAESR